MEIKDIMERYVLGIGCRRGVSSCAINHAFEQLLKDSDIEEFQIALVATCDVKSDEEGILEFISEKELDIRFFSSEELKGVDVPNPSENPLKHVGTPSVAEASAILASNGGELVVEKTKFFGDITLALAKNYSS
jgi:cobalt-precorrin 5A hydrolase / precorrin-3B C17-methyltransferase